jgi:hypothetical protein
MSVIGCAMLKGSGVFLGWTSTGTLRTRYIPSPHQIPAFSDSSMRRVCLLAFSVVSTQTQYLIRCTSLFDSNKGTDPWLLSWSLGQLLYLICHPPFNGVERSLLCVELH